MIETKLTIEKIAIVPNVEAIAREMTTTSQVGIVIKRLKLLSLVSLVRFGLSNAHLILKIAGKDFAVGIKILIELEVLAITQDRVLSQLFVHQQMIDMAVALKNTRLISYILRIARQYNLTPYLMTANVEMLIHLLASCGPLPSNMGIIVVTPQSRSVREYMRDSQLKFVELGREK